MNRGGRSKGLRDATLDAFRGLLESSDDANVVAHLVSFFEDLLSLCDWPEEVNAWNESWSDHLRFFAREVWLYVLAILINERRWRALRGLLTTTLCALDQKTLKPVGYDRFDCYLRTLEETWNARKERQRVSVLADLVKERADDPMIDFAKLMQADFVLCLRGVLPNGKDSAPSWFPRTLVFTSPHGAPFPLFVRWKAGQQLEGIRALLGVNARQEIRDGLAAADDRNLRQFRFNHWPIEFVGLAGVNDLQPKG